MKTKGTSSPAIFVHNRQRKIAVDSAALQQFAQHALPLVLREKGSGLTSLSEIHALLISDRRIARLHQRFMQVPGPTDVITFHHGEIFISVETATRQAKTHRTSLEHELQLYLVHGLLHLQGYDDHTPAARARMSDLQQGIIVTLLGSDGVRR